MYNPAKPPKPRATPGQLKRDTARIQSEIASTDGGIDPFSAAVRATRMPMVITDPRQPDNPIVFVNDAFCRLTGYGREEVIGRNCRFLQGPRSDPGEVTRLREAIAARQSISLDICNYTKNGTPFWNRLLLAPVNDANGELAYFFASQLDVTVERERLAALEDENAALTAERRANRERLEFSEESLRLATEAAEVGTWDLDLTTDVLTWSDRTKAMFGIPPDMPCCMADFYAGLHPDDREVTRAAFASALDPDRRATYDVEYRTIGKRDGLVRWIAAKGRGLFDETGRCVRALGTAIDVTARRLADEALRANEARLRFLDTLGKEVAKSTDADAILATTTRMVGEHLSISNCAYADMDPDEEGFTIRGDWAAEGSPSIIGHYKLADFGELAMRNLSAGEPLIVNDNLAELAAEEAAAFQAIGIAATICMPLVKDGRLTALMAIHDCVPHVWSDSELALIREVTERSWAHIERVRAAAAVREAADALAALNATLEQRVEERTARLSEAEAALRQSQKMEAIGQLTGGVAHDFNNLLAVVLGNLGLVRKRLPPDHKLLQLIENSIQAAERGATLTKRMLAFARRQELETGPVDVPELVRGMAELLQRSIGSSIPVSTQFPLQLPLALADANQLELALLNLTVNARDAMPEGGAIMLAAGAKQIGSGEVPGLAAGNYVVLSVTDTGEGMDEQTLGRAAEPFFTTKGLGKGTGLGLSMVHGFAEQSAGRLILRSVKGQGTTAELWLPATEAGSHSTRAPAPNQAIPSMQPLRVLVVDDDPLVLMNTSAMLEDLGHTVLEATSGPQALRVLRRSENLDLVITDQMMPGMNGTQLIEAIRAEHAELPVILASGYSELQEDKLADHVRLSKPFEQAELARAMVMSLQVRGQVLPFRPKHS